MFNKKFKQVTLTGFVVKKDPFIKNPVSLYDDFCNANFTQWTKDRKSFQGMSLYLALKIFTILVEFNFIYFQLM